ncbi:DUF441 domain-containing protein [Anaerobacillus isosaccharinicus]|uniref:UPF0756 membrane protein AWH56_014295 n=1 Tax=Anaerobacillus isosaccharinicus TaxID=1532552 RepID=A0A1S2LV78_9BACI|nr:DUF441 domain-containing protein [Anaerobacillus isosaccharinicus]MBA5587932.1 DUF441 domain-containing protein [Anaerobacillus isosaccharinicus]QOY33918.1 DUF441 domain-containing protein [Anaerobacillus isosaccharinicus]
MISQATIFMLILLLIGIIAKNQSLLIAVIVLLVIKWVGLGDKAFPLLQQKGIQIGVTIITIAVLVPIITGQIGFKELTDSMKSMYAWIALGAGIFVAIIAANGVELLQTDPHITAALVFGTIIAVALFNGVAVGPLIGAGIAYMAMKIVDFFSSI